MTARGWDVWIGGRCHHHGTHEAGAPEGATMDATMRTVVEAMRDHDRVHAPGSESPQWQALVADDDRVLGDDLDIEVNSDWAEFWVAVAARDWDRAEEYGDINPDWRDDAAGGAL